VRYRPRLAEAPLTQAGTVLVKATVAGQITATREPFDPATPAAEALTWSMSDVLPQIALNTSFTGKTHSWQPRRTLLNSPADATDFVAEVEDDGGARLRFGDDEHGLRPATDMAFTATYRIGNGSAGNVGVEAIAHVAGSAADIAKVRGVRNPLPAAGGIDPESADSVRRNAPEAFRIQERAVTLDDYAAVSERRKGVQRAAATLRWTGSWYTVFVTVDPQAGVDPRALKTDLAPFVDRYRMAGHDLEFNDPRYVSLELGLHLCVEPDYFRSNVRAGLLELFSNRVLPDGRRGLFHPDNFSFGQNVYLSTIYAAAHAVPGVASVQITKFQRQGEDDPSHLAEGQLPLGRLEIARLDNNPNFPEHGVLRLDIQGGK
jgi:predicted phage baseplate assembly protein